MENQITPDKIDPIIHERARLAIVSVLAATPQMTFNELKKILSFTDGNLSAHLRTLEEAGYLKIEKTFKARKPLTTARLTLKGQNAFGQYLELLKKIISKGKGSEKH